MAPNLLPSPFFNKAPSAYRIVPKPVSSADIAFWSARLANYDAPEMRGAGPGGPGGSVQRTHGPPAPPPETLSAACFNSCRESETSCVARKWRTIEVGSGAEWILDDRPIAEPGAAPVAKVANRIQVFPSGELEVRTVSRQSGAKAPPRSFGKRYASSVSNHGRRVIRRSVKALTQRENCQAVLYTLTSREPISDELFNKRLHSWLAWGRKYVPDLFKHYVCVVQLQQRGVIHAHLLLFKQVSRGWWLVLRNLWAIKYGMGPGSFDVKKIKRASRAAAYMTRYLTSDKSSCSKVTYNLAGKPTYEPWAVGRNGLPYERMKFRGNSYRVSNALRALALPIATYHLPWGSPVALSIASGLKGGVQFFPSSEAALEWVTANLPAP